MKNNWYSQYECLKKDLEHLVLKRFTTFIDLKNKVNEYTNFYKLEVKDFGFKSDYDNDFEDFVVAISIGNDKQVLYDLDVYFAITRIGERIITEIGIEEV